MVNVETIPNYFISSLQHDIQQKNSVLQPKSTVDAIGLAKLVKEKLHDSCPRQIFYPWPTPTNSHHLF